MARPDDPFDGGIGKQPRNARQAPPAVSRDAEQTTSARETHVGPLLPEESSSDVRQDDSTTDSRLAASPVRETRHRPVLVVIDGKRISERYVMRKPTAVLGREAEADMAVPDGRVSRQHARIVWENFEHEDQVPSCYIEDLDSRNGTLVNGMKVKRHPLKDGDRLLLGATLVGFYIKDDAELNLDQQLLVMATTDALTGLANRHYFQNESRREIDRARRYSRPLSLILLDLDHFKKVNDTYGHPAGDAVLRQVARILITAMREGDLVGRLGGEEFAVLLPETPLEGAVASAERLRDRIEHHVFTHKDMQIHATVSLGVAEFSPTYAGRESLFEAADRSLYDAKASGRNRVRVAQTPQRSRNPPDTPTPNS